MPTPKDEMMTLRGQLRVGVKSMGMAVASILIGIATTFGLARLLGQSDFGAYAFIMSTITVLTVPARIGLPQYLVRETARLNRENLFGEMRALWTRATGIVVVSSLIFAALMSIALTVPSVAHAYPASLAFALPLIPLLALVPVYGGALRGAGRPVLSQLPESILRPALYLGGIVLLYFVAGRAAPTLPDLFMVHTLVCLVTVVFAVAILGRLSTANKDRHAEPRYGTRAIVAASVSLGLINAFSTLNTNLDIMILGFLRPDGEVGVYRIAMTISGLVATMIPMLNFAILPQIVNLNDRGDTQRLQVLATRSARISFAAAIAMLAGYLIAGRWVVDIVLGPEYAGVHAPLMILFAGQMVNAFFGPVGAFLTMMGHERRFLVGVACATVASIILNLLLIPHYGMMGAAIATASTYAVWNIAAFFILRRLSGISISPFPADARR